ncbi:Cytochrome P450 [Blastococcus sp. DSM 46786]|uniref:cytochrome P450 n=1 Tax=Blastococcus sp. DSM 46786 TaxID=1798227 RepID=UPI0008CD09C0|nr:cytochrome P450 [Blastococcus sp. DSM 46786]SEL09920.1 Cytochrome P450 [Blastococcus sp. DSM 46786]
MIPTLTAPDSSLALLREGYAFISRRCDRLGTDAFRTRLMLRPAVCVRGAEAARVRSVELTSPEDSAVAAIAGHRGDDGELLDLPVAGVELLNLIRPVAAVSRFGVLAALTLLRHPRWRDAFAAGEDEDLRAFVLEVRRFFPFFPLVAGRVREPFTWQEQRFGTGDRVYLDLYGTDHDARSWTDPEVFDPERFRGWQRDPWTLIAQGAGGYAENHRCPDEPMTEWLLEDVVRLLTRSVRYAVGVQDFGISLNRLPTLPADGFVVSHVRPVPGTAAA